MLSVRFHEFGPPEVLRPEEIERPTPGPGEALVALYAIGVNYTDVVLRSGELGPLTAPEYLDGTPEPPQTPGYEGSGVVEELGEGVTGLAVGDRVAFDLVPGAYAEHVVAPQASLFEMPADMPFHAGAALPLQGLTAYYLLHRTHRTQPGEWVLVHAAAGGVGLLAVQLAKLAGARVIGTVSTEAKATLARAAGADEVLLYGAGAPDFADEVLRITGGEGADLILEGVGKATFAGSLRCVAFHGEVIAYGWPSGVPDPIGPLDLMPRAVRLTGGNLIRAFDDAERAAAFRELCELHLAGKLDVRIDRTLPLEQAAEAHRLLEGRVSAGKLLLATKAGLS
jgi:NADPH2:quinone reductase